MKSNNSKAVYEFLNQNIDRCLVVQKDGGVASTSTHFTDLISYGVQ